MDKQDILQKLKEHEKELHRLGVATLFLTKCSAKEVEQELSTIELFMTARPESNVDYIDVENIQTRLIKILGSDTHISIMSDDVLESEAVNVF